MKTKQANTIKGNRVDTGDHIMLNGHEVVIQKIWDTNTFMRRATIEGDFSDLPIDVLLLKNKYYEIA